MVALAGVVATSAAVAATPAQANPPGCTSVWLYRDDNSFGGGYARCGSGSGTAYQVQIRCKDYTTYYISYATGPWMNPGTGDSNAWCPSNSGVDTLWINTPD